MSIKSPPKILIVDDDYLTALAFADFLSGEGYSILGPFAHQDDALAAVAIEEPDLAFLDINLGCGETSEKLATYLKNKATPFAFVTGYSECPPVMAEFSDIIHIAKPADHDRVLIELRTMIGQTNTE